MTHTTFTIPTYRLRDVAETVERYDENFWRNGHAVPLVVFDDSSHATHEKYFARLEDTKTHNELYYVGPREKAEFVQMLVARLGDRKLESVVKNLFRPSYGGNRNCTLMYTLGGFLVSADDDMRPSALILALHARVLKGAQAKTTDERRRSLLAFAENLERTFYGFEADFFQQNVSRIVDDVVSQIQGALQLWPTLVEICYFQKHTRDLPKVRVKNRHLGTGVGR